MSSLRAAPPGRSVRRMRRQYPADEGRRGNPAGGRPLAAHGARQGEPAVAWLDARAPRRRTARALLRAARDRRLRTASRSCPRCRTGSRSCAIRRPASARSPASPPASRWRRRARRSPPCAPSTPRSPTRRCWRRSSSALGEGTAAVPVSDDRPQPLFAAYRTGLAGLAAALLADGERRVSALGERAGARSVEPFELLVVDDVAAFDPGFASFLSFDNADAYDGALAVPQPLVTVTGGLAGPPDHPGLDDRPRAPRARRRRGAAARGRSARRRGDAALRGRRARAGDLTG